jgi:hypothetical protein
MGMDQLLRQVASNQHPHLNVGLAAGLVVGLALKTRFSLCIG